MCYELIVIFKNHSNIFFPRKAEIIEGPNDQLMEEMIKQFENIANLPGFGENDIEEMLSSGGMDKMLEYMMEALATKDYLYEPMKEFAQKVGTFYLLD